MTVQPARPDLDAIQARTDAATPGEWAIEWDTDDVEDTPFPVSLGPIAYLEHHGERAEADAQFIAHARADVPALIAYTHLEARLDQRTGDIADHALANAELRARVAELEQQLTAAPLADWTAGLDPYDGVITLDADDQPFARIHLAFHPDMDDTDRNKFLTTLGRVVLRAL